VITKIEAYLRSYLSFPDDRYYLPLALFAMLEHCWDECFDEVPYLNISASVPGAGKTRVAELLTFLAPVGKATLESDITVAALYTEIEEGKVVMLDEAEFLYQPKNDFRGVLNGGYKRNHPVKRKVGGQVIEFRNFCPKVFCTIGDVYDSLRERCIMVVMTKLRGNGTRVEWDNEAAEEQGREIAELVGETIAAEVEAVKDAYHQYPKRYPSLSFLPDDREVEIWKPLFTLCQVFAPNRISDLERSATDISAQKTMPLRRHTDLAGEKRKAQEQQYAEQLLRDCITAFDSESKLTTADLIGRLRAMNTAPWRSFRGNGITNDASGAMLLAQLLSPFGVKSKGLRLKPKSEPHSTAKGYYIQSLLSAAQQAGLVGSNPVTLAAELVTSCDGCVTEDLVPENNCGGCGDLHRGIIEKARTNPDWDEHRLAEECGTNLTTVRAARTRFCIPGNRGVE
jgi:hypothetical protein